MDQTIAKNLRTLWGTGFIRWVFSVSFLFAAFTEFPDHKWSIGLALLTFDFAVGALLEYTQLAHLSANKLADEAERKTRHTIVLAAERAGQTDLNHGEFWGAVDRRVRDEMGPQEKTGFWKAAGLVIGGTLWRLLFSLFGIGVVATLTS